MANTSFLDLVKPAGTDKALVSVINSNSDKIDNGVSTLSEQMVHTKKFVSGTISCGEITLPNSGKYLVQTSTNNPSVCISCEVIVYAGGAVYVTNFLGDSSVSVYTKNNKLKFVTSHSGVFNVYVSSIDESVSLNNVSFAASTNDVTGYTKVTSLDEQKANVVNLQKTSLPIGQKSSWDSVYSEIPNGYAGIVIIHFQNGANITGLVYKNNASYGSILGTIDDDSNPYFYAVKNGTSALRRLAYST